MTDEMLHITPEIIARLGDLLAEYIRIRDALVSISINLTVDGKRYRFTVGITLDEDDHAEM